MSYSDDMILYIENGKHSNKKLLGLINELSKLAGYKINIQKYLHVYTNNKISEGELRKQFHLQLLQRL